MNECRYNGECDYKTTPEMKAELGIASSGNSDLLPCPFCGGEDIDSSFVRGYEKGDRSQPIVGAGCNGCGACGPTVRVPDHSTGYNEATNKWNARAR